MSGTRAATDVAGNIPDDYLECIRTRRHVIVWGRQHRQRVRIRYDSTRRGETLNLVEYSGKCELCGTERIMLRTDNLADEFVSAEYRYPDGYLAPSGRPFERADVVAEYRRRNPVGGSRVERTK